jgi:hypothetical protein
MSKVARGNNLWPARLRTCLFSTHMRGVLRHVKHESQYVHLLLFERATASMVIPRRVWTVST